MSAYFLGKETTTAPINTQTPTTRMASSSASLKTCDATLNQCLIDATTFEEKQRCRAARDDCENRINTMAQTTMPAATAAGGAGKQATMTKTTATGATQTAATRLCGENGECKQGKWCTPQTQQQDCCGEDCINGKCECQPSRKECIPGESCVGGAGDKTCGTNGKCIGAWPGHPGKCNCSPKDCKQGQPCGGPDDCGGQWCKGGFCECTKIKVCKEGATCKDASGCQPGGSCINGKCYCASGSCQTDAQCVAKHTAGWTCFKTAGSDRGICKPPDECTPGKRCTGPEKNNSQCGGAKCFRPNFKGDETVAGTCYCQGGGDGDGDGDGNLGEYTYPKNLYKNTPGKYNYPAGMQELMSLLLGRGKELMGMPLGYTEEALNKMFGLGFEKVRGTETAAREQLLQGLSRQGMSGTGTALDKTSDLAWNAENSISDLARTLFISNEEKKKQDLLDYTSAAQNILGGGGLSYESLLEGINAGRRGETFNIQQLQEAINAARRGESSTALMLLLQLLGTLGG